MNPHTTPPPLDFRARFGFHSLPFTREMTVGQRFELPFFADALTGLHRAIDQRSCAALIAPAGTGKTALLRQLRDQLPDARYQMRYIKVSRLSRRDLCKEIAVTHGIDPVGAVPAVLRRLQERFVVQSANEGTRPVLVLDEAHELRPETLDLLRILTNFEMDSRLVLSIVLAGQPYLQTMLRHSAHDAVLRRLGHIATLRLLAGDEIPGYVAHRCVIAGGLPQLFAPSGIDAIAEMTRGNLRAIDQLALKALEVAHDTNRDVVDANLVALARKQVMP